MNDYDFIIPGKRVYRVLWESKRNAWTHIFVYYGFKNGGKYRVKSPVFYYGDNTTKAVVFNLYRYFFMFGLKH